VHLAELRAGGVEQVGGEAVGVGSRALDVVEAGGERGGLGGTDPDRQPARAVALLEDDDVAGARVVAAGVADVGDVGPGAAGSGTASSGSGVDARRVRRARLWPMPQSQGPKAPSSRRAGRPASAWSTASWATSAAAAGSPSARRQVRSSAGWWRSTSVPKAARSPARAAAARSASVGGATPG
jgi:hypothetical protein